MSTVLYLYGFVPVDTPVAPESLSGLDGRTVGYVGFEGFQAAVSELDGSAYASERIEARLSDLPWVGEQGAAHERVVTWLSDHGSIAPARLFTIFSSRAALEAEAGERADEIQAQLRRFAGLREWDLKVSYDAAALAGNAATYSEAVADLDREIAEAAPGRRYLLERRREDLAADVTAEIAQGQARSFLAALEELADAVEHMEIPGRGRDLPVVLKAALLVRDDRADELQRLATERSAALEANGIHAALTGPWAPYHFMSGVDA